MGMFDSLTDPFGMFGGGDGGMFAGMSGGGALGAITGSEAIYGRKPNPVAPVTPTDITTGAAAANQAALPTLEDIGRGVDTYQLGQRRNALDFAIPGYEANTSAEASNIGDWLHGRVPTDVQNQVASSAAGKALAGGYGGSQMATALSARDLGLTSLDLQKMGGQQLNPFLKTMDQIAVPGQFDVTQGMIKPSYNPYGEYGQKVYNENLAAAPIPAAAGAAAAQMALIESLLSIYSGGGPSSAGMPGQNHTSGDGNIYQGGDYRGAGDAGYLMSPPPSSQTLELNPSMYA